MKPADLVASLSAYEGRPLTFMEVCGTHTAAISECGIPSLLPPTIRLISGPGCPVCVTVSAYIDRLIELATAPNTCVVSFGDLLRVKGSRGDLRSTIGARVEMVYTPFKALELAENDPDTTFVFAAVGFETTAPRSAGRADPCAQTHQFEAPHCPENHACGDSHPLQGGERRW